MSRTDHFALILALLAFLAAALVSQHVFDRMPHIEDEMAYVWQARVMADGDLTISSPPQSKSFLVPFVVDYQGRRFGKYPLGWPALLALGVRLGARWLVNPLLAGLAVWLTYRLAKKWMGETVGFLAALLTLSSPFFLMNAGSLLSHVWGLVLSMVFVMAWLDLEAPPGRVPAWLPVCTAGLSLGLLALTRPLTAVGVALPFGLHGLWRLARGNRSTRLRVIAVGALALLLAMFHFVWQFALTGDYFLNPYTLWWSYDKIGFGPGVGVTQAGHSLSQAWTNTILSLHTGTYDLFGWGAFSWIFIPLGIWYSRRQKQVWWMGSVALSLILVYMAYWVGAWLFGPRYYFEGLFGVTILSAVGIAGLAGWPLMAGARWPRFTDARKWRPLGVSALLALLVAVNLGGYLPARLNGMTDLFSITRSRLLPFQIKNSQQYAPAVMIVHPDHWTEYGALLELEDPYLTTPFIFVFSRGRVPDGAIGQAFPDRRVFHYYPDQPFVFYHQPRKP